jgi:peptidoglycan/xylan/chitin deacetylase (PgdA/CDA1 family)
VLCYHLISDNPVTHIYGYTYKDKKAFLADLLFLKRNFNFISYEELTQSIFEKRKLKKDSLLLTFDDGFSQCFTDIRPVLLEEKISAVFFVSTDFLDNQLLNYEEMKSLCINALEKIDAVNLPDILSRAISVLGIPQKNLPQLVKALTALGYKDQARIKGLCDVLNVDIKEYLLKERPYLITEEIKTLAAEGFKIGAHGQRHIRLDLLSPKEIEEEIAGSCKKIAEITGSRKIPFAFPYHGMYLDRRLLKSIREKYGFIDLFFDTQHLRNDYHFVVNRVWADPAQCLRQGRSNLPRLLRFSYVDFLTHPRKKVFS